MIKVLLVGERGTGKSTFVEIAKEVFPGVYGIRIAVPLYQVQSLIYDFCGIQKDFEQQDDVLLTFLGKHLKCINPQIYEKHFEEQMEVALRKASSMVICSDARPPNVDFIIKKGFKIIRIEAEEQAKKSRLIARHDIVFEDAVTPRGLIFDGHADFVITNNATIQEYRSKILEIVRLLS
ncbi:conserved hypothetical protein [Alphaproteobacteria bacterium]